MALCPKKIGQWNQYNPVFLSDNWTSNQFQKNTQECKTENNLPLLFDYKLISLL